MSNPMVILWWRLWWWNFCFCLSQELLYIYIYIYIYIYSVTKGLVEGLEDLEIRFVWFGLVLWHINYCRLFNALSIFYTYKQLYFQPFSLAQVHFLVYTQSNIKTILFQTIQSSISTEFSSFWPIDKTLSGATSPRWQWRDTPHSPKLQYY